MPLARTASTAAVTPPGCVTRSRAISITWEKPAPFIAASLASRVPAMVMVSMP